MAETGNKIEDDLTSEFKEAVEFYNETFGHSEKFTDAITKCKDIMQSYPAAAEPYFLLGLMAYRLGDEGQAISMCETAHKMAPDIVEYAEALSVILIGVGHLADGLYYAKIAPTLESHPYISTIMPHQMKDLQGAFETAAPSSHFIEALRLFNLADYARVLKECSSEIRIHPDNFDAYVLFARTLAIIGNYHQAESALHAAIQLDADASLPKAMLARVLVNLGKHAEAQKLAEFTIKHSTPDPETYAQAMNALLRCPGSNVSEAKVMADNFQVRFDEENDPDPDKEIESDQNAPVHIGFSSNAFFSSPHSEQFASWFSVSRAQNIKYYGYQQSIAHDSVTTAAKGACENWREIYDIDPYTLSLTMKADELDVLVDLSGTDWLSRPDIIALSGIPARVGSFALPEPGFAPGVTHVLSDDVLVDADEKNLRDGQEIIKVSGSLFARSPYFVLKNDLPVPAENNGYVTFGGVADLALLSPQCAILWGQILHAAPGSKLLLCGAEHMNDRSIQKIREYFSHAGVLGKIMFPVLETDEESEPALETAEATIPNAQWRQIDVFLDTTPFSCRAQICEALWTGAPVISLKGDRRAGLVGASILAAAKRLNWIAQDEKEYITLAAELAQNTNKLKEERERLQKNIANSALFDDKGLASQIRTTLADAARKIRARQSSSKQ